MEISEIKTRLTITEVLHHYRLKPTAKGALQCPFPCHPATQPGNKKKTLQIYTDTHRYQCFHKDCTVGNGDVIDFIEQMENCSKHQAIEKAKQLIGFNDPVSVDTSNAASDAIPEKDRASGTNPPEELSSGAGSHLDTERSDHLIYTDTTFTIDILGGLKLEGLDRMRVTLKLVAHHQVKPKAPEVSGRALRHTLDLYNDDQVQKLLRKAAERLETGTSTLTESLDTLIDQLERYRLDELEKQATATPKAKTLTEAEKQAAITFLQAPGLMQNTNALLGESGIIGEETNRQILWLVYSSRKRPKPLHVICLGASGTGKTYLQEKVSRFIPETEKFTFTASTENAFYYLEPYDLCHKVVLIEDMDGVQYLLYPLRELQTKHWISKIVPVKDQQQHNKTRKLEVFGPICLSGTTTKESLYEDNANRCLLLHLDNSAAQQEAIMEYQRKQSAGKIHHETEHQAATTLEHLQYVLKPVNVINPYAESLRIPTSCFKPLRTHDHYLQFIETVTWYHQYQRAEQADENGELYISTTLEDIATANHLLKDILLTKSDELPQSLRQFFEQVKHWLKTEKQTSFYTKQLRSHFRLYPMKANRYVRTLEQYGHLKKVGGNRKQGYEYEVAHWDDYTELKDGLNILDHLLAELKAAENPEEITIQASITEV